MLSCAAHSFDRLLSFYQSLQDAHPQYPLVTATTWSIIDRPSHNALLSERSISATGFLTSIARRIVSSSGLGKPTSVYFIPPVIPSPAMTEPCPRYRRARLPVSHRSPTYPWCFQHHRRLPPWPFPRRWRRASSIRNKVMLQQRRRLFTCRSLSSLGGTLVDPLPLPLNVRIRLLRY